MTDRKDFETARRDQDVFALAQALGAVVPIEIPWPTVRDLAAHVACCTADQLLALAQKPPQ